MCLLHKIEYREQPALLIKEGGGWCFDNKIVPNFNLHVMSLRWIERLNEEVQIKCLEEFITYHKKDNLRSSFYLGPRADHTASIRLGVLSRFVLKEHIRNDLKILIIDEIKKTINSCLSGETYRKACNHGLMVDASLLSLIGNQFLSERILESLDVLISRTRDQLNAIFTETGASKEHSVSYQEYNLGVLYDFRKDLAYIKSAHPSLEIFYKEVDRLYQNVKILSKKLLGFALTKSNGYINFGDSPNSPKLKILKKVYNKDTIKECLHPFSQEEGFFYSKEAGFLFQRFGDFHFGMTSSWHSHIHKQDDDLSIWLAYKDKPIILDGGYSGVVRSVDFKSNDQHSSVAVVGANFSKRSLSGDGYSTLDYRRRNAENLGYIIGRHNRVEGYTIERSVIFYDEAVVLCDKVYSLNGGGVKPSVSSDASNSVFRHRFILSDDMDFDWHDGGVVLNGELLLEYAKKVMVDLSYGEIVSFERSVPAIFLDFYSDNGVFDIVISPAYS